MLRNRKKKKKKNSFCLQNRIKVVPANMDKNLSVDYFVEQI